MNKDLETCVIRLMGKADQTQGAGFVITPSLVVTCARVMTPCGAKPSEAVWIIFRADDVSAVFRYTTGRFGTDEEITFSPR